MVRERVYLDHLAGAPLAPEARAVLLRQLERGPGNPSSPHLEGRAAKDALELARTQVARSLDVRPREILFTAGGTEALQIALHGTALARAGVSRRLLAGAVEHPAVLEPLAALGKQGFEPLVVPVGSDGELSVSSFVESARPGAAVAALMLANHEMGAVFAVQQVAQALGDLGIPLVCDAALGPGRLACRPKDLGAPLIAYAAHKFGGPPGMGLLYVRRGTRLTPWLRGGLQEERLRPGTENVAGALATAAALQAAVEQTAERAVRYQELVRLFLTRIASLADVRPVGPGADGLPGALTLEIGGVEGEAAMINLDLEGVAVSTGSACALGGSDPSPGLLAMGLSKKRAASTVRISVGEGNTTAQIERAATLLCAIVDRLRALARGMAPRPNSPA